MDEDTINLLLVSNSPHFCKPHKRLSYLFALALPSCRIAVTSVARNSAHLCCYVGHSLLVLYEVNW